MAQAWATARVQFVPPGGWRCWQLYRCHAKLVLLRSFAPARADARLRSETHRRAV